MSRTVRDIESDIAAIKAANPHWLQDDGDKALITALIDEKNNANIVSKTVTPTVGYVRSIPGDDSSVYGLVLHNSGDVKGVIGTAFAISDNLAISAWHNFTDNDYEATDGIILCKEIRGNTILTSSPVVRVLDYDVNDNWVILQLVESKFPYHATLCSEGELPPEHDGTGQSRVLGVRYFPVGLIDPRRSRTVANMYAKLWNYSVPFSPHDNMKLCIMEQLPEAHECMVNVRGDRALTSCGAPYFAANDKVIAFHVRSVYDTISEGRVLALQKSFTTKYAHLFC